MTPGPHQEMPKRRDLARLMVLLAILAAVLAYRFWPTGNAAPTSEPAASTGSGAPVQTAGGAAVVPESIQLQTLDPVPAARRTDRNPFAFGVHPTPPPPPSVGQPVAPPAPVRPSGPPPIALRLVGVTVMSKSGRSFATLTEPSTNGLYHVFEGDIVDGRYRVLQVGPRSVVVSYLDGSGKRTLALGG